MNYQDESSIYANRQTEVKVNQEYFEKMGIATEEEEIPNQEDLKEAKIQIDLDADYFQWKEEQGVEEKDKSGKEKSERFQNVLKKLTSGKN